MTCSLSHSPLTAHDQLYMFTCLSLCLNSKYQLGLPSLKQLFSISNICFILLDLIMQLFK